MNIIVETDIGRDADDFFALCYLLSTNVNIKAITISPGDKDQVAVVKFILNYLGISIPVGSAKPCRDKKSVGGVHPKILRRYNSPERCEPDGLGKEIILDTLKSYPDCELFCIGPLHNVGDFLIDNPSVAISRCTMQGGFASYELFEPETKLEKFNSMITCPTFNLGGYKRGAIALTTTSQIGEKLFAGKNVCHSISCTPEILHEKSALAKDCPSMNLFLETLELFFESGAPYKCFHDPTAAVCMLHPEIGTWINGTLYYEEGKWGTELGGTHKVLVDINREQLWNHIFSGT